MSALDNMRTRLSYYGGDKTNDRMIAMKLRSLKRSFNSAYQSNVIVLSDEREFKCLINPDKQNEEEDYKEISIPFKDICLNKNMIGSTTEGQEEIGLKNGDVFKWKDTNTYWLVFLQYLEEKAYFRAKIRRCDYEIDVNGTTYRVHVKKPEVQNIEWLKETHEVTNKLNYHLELYVTENEETLDFFKRFKTFKFENKMWEVQFSNSFSGDGIIQVILKETYSNTIADTLYEEIVPSTTTSEGDTPHIVGTNVVRPYDEVTFSIANATDGVWSLSNEKAIITSQDSSKVNLAIVTGKSGSVTLTYTYGDSSIDYEITITSL